MRSVPPAGRAFFPLDEELALAPGYLTPYVHERVVRLATWMSFVRAGREAAHFTGVTVGGTTVRRLTERAGAAYVAVQTAAVTLLERELPAPPEGPAVQYLSVDGAMVPLVGGVWAEVRTLALGAVVVREVQTRRDRERTVHAQDLSYFARLTDHDTFARLATVETQRRGTETAGVVCAVVDGASWIQDFIDWHRPDAVRILDWPHALGYVAGVATAVYGADTAAARTWLARHHRVLLEEEDGPALVLADLRRLRTDLAAVAEGDRASLVWTVAAGEGTAAVPLTGVLGQEMAQRALGEVVVREVQTRRDRERTVHAQDLSYFSRLTDHETFARLALVETQRRGTARAGVVCAVGDGAPWIQDFIAWHRPDAVRILDWPHALGYVAKVATAV